MNDLDPKAAYDPTFLFIRADERVEAVEITVKDLDKEQQHIREDILAFKNHYENRVEKGVAVSGQKNREDLAMLATRVALVEQKQEAWEDRLFHEETGLFKQFKDLREWKEKVTMVITGFFITAMAGGIITWAFTKFR